MGCRTSELPLGASPGEAWLHPTGLGATPGSVLGSSGGRGTPQGVRTRPCPPRCPVAQSPTKEKDKREPQFPQFPRRSVGHARPPPHWFLQGHSESPGDHRLGRGVTRECSRAAPLRATFIIGVIMESGPKGRFPWKGGKAILSLFLIKNSILFHYILIDIQQRSGSLLALH